MTGALALQGVTADRGPANDNHGPSSRGDKWVYIIDKFKTIHMPLAVAAARIRLRGVTAEQFCLDFLRMAKAAGWECAQDWDG